LIMTEFDYSFGRDAMESRLAQRVDEFVSIYSLDDFDLCDFGCNFDADALESKLAQTPLGDFSLDDSFHVDPELGEVTALQESAPEPLSLDFDTPPLGGIFYHSSDELLWSEEWLMWTGRGSRPLQPGGAAAREEFLPNGSPPALASSDRPLASSDPPIASSVVAVAPEYPRPPTPEALGRGRMEIEFKYPKSIKNLHFGDRKCVFLKFHASWYLKLRCPRGFIPRGAEGLVKITLREFSQKVGAKETKFAIHGRKLEDDRLVITIMASEENKIGPFPYTSFKDATSIRAFQYCASFEGAKCLSEPFLCDGNRDRKLNDLTENQHNDVTQALIGLENSDFDFPTTHPQIYELPQLKTKLRADVKGHCWNEWFTAQSLRFCCNGAAHLKVDEVEFMSSDGQAYKLFYCPVEGECAENFVFLECKEAAGDFSWRIVKEVQTGRSNHKVVSVLKKRSSVNFTRSIDRVHSSGTCGRIEKAAAEEERARGCS
jgi:hypothetical protein